MIQGGWIVLVSYPRATLNGQPKIAPAATPSTAMEVLSIYQPVMPINVVYIQKLLGRNAAREKKWKKRKGGQEFEVYWMLIIKNFPTWQNVNNQEHILSNAILEMDSKVILFKKMKYNHFLIFSLLFLGTNTCSLHNTNYAILLDCTPNLKLTEFQVSQVYPQVIFAGREYASVNLEPLMTIYFWRNLSFDSLLRLS